MNLDVPVDGCAFYRNNISSRDAEDKYVFILLIRNIMLSNYMEFKRIAAVFHGEEFENEVQHKKQHHNSHECVTGSCFVVFGAVAIWNPIG